MHKLINHINHQIKPTFRNLQQNWSFKIASIITLVCMFAGLSILVLKWKVIPAQVPFWYSKTWGEERLASKYYLPLLMVGMWLWYLINVFILSPLVHKQRIYIQILMLTTSLVAISIGVFIYQVVIIIS